MTPDELSALECREYGPEGNDAVSSLSAEVRRLRGLIERAQFKGQWEHCTTCHSCPWCGYDATCNTKRRHAPECPAFTESGEVR